MPIAMSTDQHPPLPPPLLDVSGLSKSFAGFKALDGVDFSLRAGEIHALLGENGAGKVSFSIRIAPDEAAAFEPIRAGAEAAARALPGISRDAQGRPLLSPELSQVVNLVSKSDGTDVNAQFRGVGPQAWAVHDKVRIVEGRKFATGLREIVVGQGAKGQFRDMEVGRTLSLGR